MNDDWQWLIGLLAGFGLAIVGGFRNVYKKISEGHGDLHRKIDEVKATYVTRDHLDIHLQNITERMDDLKEDGRSRHEELKDLIGRREPKL